MDARIEKAFEVANYMATLSTQRRIIIEEFTQRLVYYVNGATFIINPELINFTKSVLDIGHTQEVAFVDSNTMPVIIHDVKEFFEDILNIYFESLNDYAVKYASIASKRNISDLVDL